MEQQKPQSPPYFQACLQSSKQAIEARLDTILSPAAEKTAWPPRLLSAMRYSVFNGGKRLRPFLLLQSAELLADNSEPRRQKQLQAALECAAALECVHCYSLIHDDLPAMDNDDWRRGQPTVHKAYDEATALLAGNALLTFAFQILTEADNALPPALQAQLCRYLAQAAGAGGMTGGQILDIAAEHRQRTAEEIIDLEMMKTGSLLQFSCSAAALITERDAEIYVLMEKFGAALGFVYQLADDILDMEGSQTALGKTPGKDEIAGKATLPALWGIDKAHALLTEKSNEAQAMLAPFGEKAKILQQTAAFIATRSH